ncbi:MAG: hypothetical protein ACLP4V_30895 [Methylocella sp.]
MTDTTSGGGGAPQAALAGIPEDSPRGRSTNDGLPISYSTWRRMAAINFQDHFDTAFGPLANPLRFVGPDELLLKVIAQSRERQIPFSKNGGASLI